MKSQKRKVEIRAAVIAVKDAAKLVELWTLRGAQDQAKEAEKILHRAENDLYDAIGGMDEYKY